MNKQKLLKMRTKHFILASLLFFLSFNTFAKEVNINLDGNDVTEEVFTAKDKDFLQQWHYNQVSRMDLHEEGLYDYFAILNQYTYKMSRLGLPKYQLTDAERKQKFDELAEKLDASMKKELSPKNYIIHLESFNKIEEIVYEKRNWME